MAAVSAVRGIAHVRHQSVQASLHGKLGAFAEAPHTIQHFENPPGRSVSRVGIAAAKYCVLRLMQTQ